MSRPIGADVTPLLQHQPTSVGPSPRAALRRFGAGLLAALLLEALLIAPPSPFIGVAAAESPAPSSKAEAPSRDQQAEALFRKARDLLDQGNREQACALFERSLELKMSPGILLNLGNCYEQDGDLLRSVATFERAIIEGQPERDAAKRKKWLDAATQRRAAVLDRIPSVVIKPSPTPDVRVTIDGSLPESLGGVVRVNPGRHHLEATAEGKQPYLHDFDVVQKQKLELELPALGDLPKLDSSSARNASGLPPEPAPRTDVRREKSALPWVFVGAGAGIGALSIVTALVAKSKENELDQRCNTPMGGSRTCEDPALESVKTSGENWALATYLAWGATAVSLGIGVTLLAIGDEETESSATFEAACFGERCGLSASGRF